MIQAEPWPPAGTGSIDAEMGQHGKESQMEVEVVLALLVALGALVLGDGRGGSNGFRPQAARHHPSGRQGPAQPWPSRPTVPAETSVGPRRAVRATARRATRAGRSGQTKPLPRGK
jgi:hypothetical protein